MNKLVGTRQIDGLTDVVHEYGAAKQPRCQEDVERRGQSGLISLLAGPSSDGSVLDAEDEATDWLDAVIADLDRELLGRTH